MSAFRRLCLACFVLLHLGALQTFAHIGSPAVFFEGAAGPHPVRISIQPPEVVPGRARINVRVHNGGANSVSALPVRWDAGRKGAPPPDMAKLVPGETNLYSTELWIMDFGAYSVFVDVEGAAGKGTAIVPLNSVSNQRLEMPKWMGVAFLIAGSILFGLLILLVGAGVRESVLPPGAEITRKLRWRGYIASAVATIFLGLVLWKGKQWWDEVDADFRNNRLYTPIEMSSRLQDVTRGGSVELEFDPNAREWRDPTPLVPDHGKLMHLFLVREPLLDAFAHLHPQRTATNQLRAGLPWLPPGEYSLYGDITHESGLAQTLISKLYIPSEFIPNEKGDPDDSWWVDPANLEPPRVPPRRIQWLNEGTITQKQEVALQFTMLSGDGKRLPLEPYMGMWGHAVVRSKDGSVFTHLHPSGTISMAAQELFARREQDQRGARGPLDVVCGGSEEDLAFPYMFPKAGDYRIWVQAKSGGKVVTTVFNVTVI